MKRKKRLGSSDNKDPKPTVNDQEITDKVNLGRRGFLKIGAGAAAVTLANPLEAIAQRRTTNGQDPLSGDCSEEPFTEPTKVFPDPDNVLRHELNAEPLKWVYECNNQTKVGLQPVFNSALPGPSLYVDKGTTISLLLRNKLDLMPKFKDDNCADGHHVDPTKPACFAHTNLHFHGLQVSPCSINSKDETQCGAYALNGSNPPYKFSSDDVLVDIFPGQKNQYKVVLPDMHAPGTNWYHSHLHGASAYQVSGGMAGAIIIREPDEKSRIVRQDLDKLFLIQEVLVNPIPTSTQPWPDYPPIYASQPAGGGTLTQTQMFVNGRCRPTLHMKKGQMMRWRFINAAVTPSGLMTLKVVKTQTCSPTFPNPVPQGEVLHLMAMDGLSFYGINPQPVRYHLLALGSRADFLVKFDQPGYYTILKDSYPLESVTKPASTTITRATDPAFNPTARQVLMYVYVDDVSGYNDQIPRVIPGEKPAYLQAISKVDKVRTQPVKFQNPGAAKFQIDGAPYAANGSIDVELNTAEEWTLQNEAIPASGGSAPPQSNTHPFHVHLNPFQIVNIPFDFEVTDADLQLFGFKRMDPTNPCNWPFWDTVALPGAVRKPDRSPPDTTSIKIWSRFLIYAGEYVTHCHILIHEDVGMMINVKLIGKGIPPGEAVKDYPIPARECIDRTSKPCPTT